MNYKEVVTKSDIFYKFLDNLPLGILVGLGVWGIMNLIIIINYYKKTKQLIK